MLVLAVVIAASAPISMMLVGTPVVNLLVSQLIVAVEALIMIMLLSFLPTIAPFLEKNAADRDLLSGRLVLFKIPLTSVLQVATLVASACTPHLLRFAM